MDAEPEMEDRRSLLVPHDGGFCHYPGVLNYELQSRQPLILYASHPHFEQTNAIPEEIGEATGGVTEALKRRVVLPLAGPLGETDHVLGHEIVHAFQFGT